MVAVYEVKSIFSSRVNISVVDSYNYVRSFSAVKLNICDLIRSLAQIRKTNFTDDTHACIYSSCVRSRPRAAIKTRFFLFLSLHAYSLYSTRLNSSLFPRTYESVDSNDNTPCASVCMDICMHSSTISVRFF